MALIHDSDATKKIIDSKNEKKDEKRNDLPGFKRDKNGVVTVVRRDNKETFGNSKRKPNFGYDLE